MIIKNAKFVTSVADAKSLYDTQTSEIAIAGKSNVGKSSLLNKILGQKVSIVSDKPQTTRTRIMGVFTEKENQFVFIDTPGFHKPRNTLGEKMIKAVFIDFYGTLVFEDGEIVSKIGDRIYQSGNAQSASQIGS